MEHCIKIGTFGSNRKGKLDKLCIDDRIAFYITKERKIIGVGRLTEPYYVDDTQIFLKEGVFPDRIKFAGEKFAPADEINFIDLVDQLDFITNVAYWTVYLRSGFVEMTKNDWKLITSKLNKGGRYLSEAT